MLSWISFLSIVRMSAALGPLVVTDGLLLLRLRQQKLLVYSFFPPREKLEQAGSEISPGKGSSFSIFEKKNY